MTALDSPQGWARMGKDGQAEARRFHGETQQDTGGAGYLFRTPGEGLWSLDVVGLFKPQKHEKT